MRRLTLYSALIAALTLAGSWFRPKTITIHAQAFPVTVHAEVQANAASDQVTSYTFQLDAGTAQSVGTTVDAACNCIKSGALTITDSALHTITARAVNVWGSSGPATISFQVKVPNAPSGATVKPGQ